MKSDIFCEWLKRNFISKVSSKHLLPFCLSFNGIDRYICWLQSIPKTIHNRTDNVYNVFNGNVNITSHRHFNSKSLFVHLIRTLKIAFTCLVVTMSSLYLRIISFRIHSATPPSFYAHAEFAFEFENTLLTESKKRQRALIFPSVTPTTNPAGFIETNSLTKTASKAEAMYLQLATCICFDTILTFVHASKPCWLSSPLSCFHYFF
jgi:hypothetical protein